MVSVTVRKAILDDRVKIYKWRNEPSIYNKGFSGQPVEWDEHCEWFAGQFYNQWCEMYIIRADGKDVGQIRFQFSEVNHVWYVSIYITDKHTRKGIGWRAIRIASNRLLRITSFPTIEAMFLSQNIASKKAFKKAGYTVYGKNKMRYKLK